MITPTLNINGTSAADLIEPRRQAIDALRTVTETLAHVTPNGRDYPGDNERCRADRVTHYDRIETLSRIGYELMREAVAIQEQTK